MAASVLYLRPRLALLLGITYTFQGVLRSRFPHFYYAMCNRVIWGSLTNGHILIPSEYGGRPGSRTKNRNGGTFVVSVIKEV